MNHGTDLIVMNGKVGLELTDTTESNTENGILVIWNIESGIDLIVFRKYQYIERCWITATTNNFLLENKLRQTNDMNPAYVVDATGPSGPTYRF